MITIWLLSNVAAVVRRTAVLAVASLLIVGLSSATLPPPWHGVPAALAEAGGNGKGNNGNGKGNGGPTGEHPANGNGSAAKSEKEKDKQKKRMRTTTMKARRPPIKPGLPRPGTRPGRR